MLINIETRKKLKPIEVAKDTPGVKYFFYCGLRREMGVWPFVRRMYDIDTIDAPPSAIEAFLDKAGVLESVTYSDFRRIGDY